LHHAGRQRLSLPEISNSHWELDERISEGNLGEFILIGSIKKERESERAMWKVRNRRLPRLPEFSPGANYRSLR
jgi:hypothetical protein